MAATRHRAKTRTTATVRNASSSAKKGPVSKAMGQVGKFAGYFDRQAGKLIGMNPSDLKAAYEKAYYKAKEADDAFQAALEEKYGGKAGDARYSYKSHGAHIDALKKKKLAADEAMHKALARMRSDNPATSPQQYRLAQAALSGTAKQTGMTKEVAQEIVDRTPKKLRSEWSKANPISPEKERLYAKAKEADDAFQAALEKEYKSRAGDMRYQTGKQSPHVRALGKKFQDAMERYHKANPEGESADMYESFHGKPSESIAEFIEEEHYHGNLAELGQLISLIVVTVSGLEVEFCFDFDEPTDCVLLASNESGTQMYFVGGTQELDLKEIKMDGDYERDSMVIGECLQIDYLTKKDYDDWEPIVYQHTFGEDEDTKEEVSRPVLIYDAMNRRLSLSGGEYVIKRPLFETSRGIEK